MNNTDEIFRKYPVIGCQGSSILCVALMLLLVDLLFSAVAVTIGAGDNMRGQVGFVVKMYRNASKDDISECELVLSGMTGVREVTHTPADVVLEEERVFNPELLSMMGYNPFSDEFEVMLQAAYANTDSLTLIKDRVSAMSYVEDVYMQPDMADSVNEILSRIQKYLTIFVLVLSVISFVMIFNTMKLAVYSRRFTIYNMRIVGATRNYILKPFLLGGLVTALVSSLVSFMMLMALVWYSSTFDYNIFFALSAMQYVMIYLSSLCVGIMLCVGASYCAASKYIDSTYDELFG